MPRLAYKAKKFSQGSLETIVMARDIIAEYEAAGYQLTLRQLYYQFVARGLIANKDSEYKRLGSTINDARLAGAIDWKSIVDRTREMTENSHWSAPGDIISAAARSWHTDLWADQDYYIEVWIEKDALEGVIEPVCKELDVPCFSCRGYASQSSMWAGARRILHAVGDGTKKARILHLGDHDPSGIDMSRDIEERISQFVAQDMIREYDWDVEDVKAGFASADPWFRLDRLALNMDQVDEYQPPPNPAKLTDSRGAGYIAEYGRESWELDALPPDVLGDLIRGSVATYRDDERMDVAIAAQETAREQLTDAASDWQAVVDHLRLGGE